MPERVNVGGQAVIEGVMMRRKKAIAIAVRRPDHGIALICENVAPFSERLFFLSWPILRGVVALIESLVLGIRSLSISANQALGEEDEEISSGEMMMAVGVALMFGIGLFVFLPTLLVNFLKTWIDSFLFLNLIEGVLRLLLFLLYIYGVSRWKDIERVFQYHGAEHKAVHCLEAGKPLTIEHAQSYSTLHPRCGTAFLLLVMIIGILLFAFFGWPSLLIRLMIRLVFLPLIAGLAYEGIRLAGLSNNIVLQWLISPGLWLQKLTTREPDDGQVEVALCALKAVLPQKRGV